MRRPPTRKELGLESRYTAKKFRPYALAIGEPTLSWNDLHVERGMLFVTVSGGGLANYYFEIWNSLRNDSAKREILMAAARVSLNPALERDQRAFQEVKWIVDEVGKLTGDRNMVAHAPLTSTRSASHVFPNAWPGDRFEIDHHLPVDDAGLKWLTASDTLRTMPG
jgi:hypothetical protein